MFLCDSRSFVRSLIHPDIDRNSNRKTWYFARCCSSSLVKALHIWLAASIVCVHKDNDELLFSLQILVLFYYSYQIRCNHGFSWMFVQTVALQCWALLDWQPVLHSCHDMSRRVTRRHVMIWRRHAIIRHLFMHACKHLQTCIHSLILHSIPSFIHKFISCHANYFISCHVDHLIQSFID